MSGLDSLQVGSLKHSPYLCGITTGNRSQWDGAAVKGALVLSLKTQVQSMGSTMVEEKKKQLLKVVL